MYFVAEAWNHTIQDLKFELLEHPPYIPDLVPSDFHLFRPIKMWLWGLILWLTRKWTMWRFLGCADNPKHFFFVPVESWSWFNAGPNTLKGGRLCKKLYTLYFYVTSCKSFILLPLFIDWSSYIHTYMKCLCKYIHMYTHIFDGPIILTNNRTVTVQNSIK
jgi:hypothetical protein